MSETPDTGLLEVSQVKDATVVRFKRRSILDPVLIEQAGQCLQTLIQEQNCRRLVLNFAQVESITSGMFGKLVSLYAAIDRTGGRLVFAAVDPFLMQIFRVCNLPATIPIVASEAEAVQALAAGTPNQG
jgi:anti-anti-sigma factor